MFVKLDLTRVRTLLLASAAALALLPRGAGAAGQAQSLTVQEADPARKGDGTLGPAAGAALKQGPLPASAADVAAKDAANGAYDEAVRAGQLAAPSRDELAPAGGAPTAPQAPGVVGRRSFAGVSWSHPRRCKIP